MPSVVHVAVTEKLVDLPDGTAKVHVAVPVLEKSPLVNPETGSVKVSEYTSVREVDGDAGAVHVAVGDPESIVTVDADTAVEGP